VDPHSEDPLDLDLDLEEFEDDEFEDEDFEDDELEDEDLEEPEGEHLGESEDE
jgi:DNA-directed RNA polymerase subunit delta